jgi:hypothetical protein
MRYSTIQALILLMGCCAVSFAGVFVPTPEPNTAALIGCGIAAAGVMLWKRNRRK